jgi:hypothetical protein
MSNWTQRAKACFSQTGQAGTDKTDETDETRLLSVLAVPTGAIYKFPDLLSSVSSVGVWAVFEKTALAEELIEAAMLRCDQFGDSDQAREQMRQDCLSLSPAMQQDLLAHFAQTTTAPTDGPKSTDQVPAPDRQPTAKAPPWHHIDVEWHRLAEVYHLHHFGCPTCISAGQGRGLRCGAGAALWTGYQDASA